jgi:hypothetical protein
MSDQPDEAPARPLPVMVAVSADGTASIVVSRIPPEDLANALRAAGEILGSERFIADAVRGINTVLAARKAQTN